MRLGLGWDTCAPARSSFLPVPMASALPAAATFSRPQVQEGDPPQAQGGPKGCIAVHPSNGPALSGTRIPPAFDVGSPTSAPLPAVPHPQGAAGVAGCVPMLPRSAALDQSNDGAAPTGQLRNWKASAQVTKACSAAVPLMLEAANANRKCRPKVCTPV